MVLLNKKLLILGLGAALFGSACAGTDTVEVSGVENDSSNSEPASESSDDSANSTFAASGFQTETVNLATGEKTTLSDFVDGTKPVVLWGWAPHCGSCRAEVADFNEFAEKNPDVLVIGIGQTDNLELAKDFYSATSPNFELVYAEDGTVWDDASVGFQQMVIYSPDLKQKTDTKNMRDKGYLEASIAAF